MPIGMSDVGTKALWQAFQAMNDHDLSLVPEAAADEMRERVRKQREKVLSARREEQSAQRQYETLLDKFKLPDAP